MRRNWLRLSFASGQSKLSLTATDALLGQTQRLADSRAEARSSLGWQIAASHVGDVAAISALALIAARTADEEILIERELRAPRGHVWAAWTTPALIKRWWGGRRGTVTDAEVELRLGGRWRFVLVSRRGTRSVVEGEFCEIDPQRRIVWTQVDEPTQCEWLMTARFADARDDHTRVAILMHLPSAEARQAAVRAGVEFVLCDQLTLLEQVARSCTAV